MHGIRMVRVPRDWIRQRGRNEIFDSVKAFGSVEAFGVVSKCQRLCSLFQNSMLNLNMSVFIAILVVVASLVAPANAQMVSS